MFAATQSYCGSLGGGSRLPSVKELLTLVDFTKNPSTSDMVDRTVFTSPTDFYWTSTQAAGESRSVWTIDFQDGSLGSSARPPPQAELSATSDHAEVDYAAPVQSRVVTNRTSESGAQDRPRLLRTSPRNWACLPLGRGARRPSGWVGACSLWNLGYRTSVWMRFSEGKMALEAPMLKRVDVSGVLGLRLGANLRLNALYASATSG